MTRRVAKFEVSTYLLADALHLPQGTAILHCTMEPPADKMTIFVEHKDLNEVEEGLMAPLIVPRFTRVPEKITCDWNQQEQKQEPEKEKPAFLRKIMD